MIVFLWVMIIVCLSLLTYQFISHSRRSRAFSQKITVSELQLQQSQETSRQLQTELKTLESKVSGALEDPVTHLLGWQLFEDHLRQNMKESERYQLTMGILFIDIDDFKVINDALGYEIGDQLLQEVAQRLYGCIRQVDSISRFNKDVFVAVITQLSKPETAALVAQRVLQALAQPFQIDKHELFITACIGISIYPTDGRDTITLLRSAEHALQLAKEKNKHVYQFYQEKMHIDSQRELVLHNNLKREAVFNEFTLYYQPVINVLTNATFCMDARLAWQHPELGLIQAEELYLYGEKQRKLNALTEWLLQNACQQYLQWNSLGFYPEYLGITVSVKQLENSQFIYRLSQIMQDLAFKPEWLLIAIKDSSAQLPSDMIDKAFNMLKYLGIKLAVENFGSAQFSFSSLKTFSMHYLKLDPLLIEGIEKNDEQAMAAIESLVLLCTRLAMHLIVQGVTSDDQVRVLRELGCIYMCGPALGGVYSEQEVTKKLLVSISE